MEFTVKNPNRRINLWFSGLDVVLLHENSEISKGIVQGFSLRKRSEAKRMKVNCNNGGIKGGNMNNSSKKEVDFNVKMNGLARFRAGKWIHEEKQVQVLCKNLKMGDNAEADGCVSSIDS
ncbi:unnamed protein product [Fraxinus pennsylvanica]|uniref:Uncharacterized protein n=1 Tax=Fraxinus pennsylvanica TaxID=56036 RepID=A0AAD2DS26_9LAMI|nr:unnamed protein product [Fraxinus pennsylvanica]